MINNYIIYSLSIVLCTKKIYNRFVDENSSRIELGRKSPENKIMWLTFVPLT